MRYYVLGFLLLSSSCFAGLTPEEKTEKFGRFASKLEDFTRSLASSYLDRAHTYADLQENYKIMKIMDAKEAFKSLKEGLGASSKLNAEDLESYIESEKIIACYNAAGVMQNIDILKETEKFSSPELKASYVFGHLLKQHYTYLNTRLERLGAERILPTAPESIEKMKNLSDKRAAQRSVDVYQERIYFLRKLYPLIDLIFLSDKTRAQLVLDQGLTQKLEKKIQDFGHPDLGLESYPHDHYVSRLFNPTLPQADAKTSKNSQKKLAKDLKRRPPILFHLQMDIIPKETEVQVRPFPLINFDALSKISSQKQKQDPKQVLLAQVRSLFSGATVSKISLAYDEWEKEQISSRRKPAPRIRPVSEKEYAPPLQPVQDAPKTMPVHDGASAQEGEKEMPLRAKGPEKDRQKRKENWEKQQTLKQAQVISPKSEEGEKEQSLYQFSSDTLAVLMKIFNKKEGKNLLKWSEFTSAWRELRSTIDGVFDAKIMNMSGSARKIQGGPLQEGRKRKPRSFVIHEPHPSEGGTLGPKSLERIAAHFSDKFGWTPEKLGVSVED